MPPPRRAPPPLNLRLLPLKDVLTLASLMLESLLRPLSLPPGGRLVPLWHHSPLLPSHTVPSPGGPLSPELLWFEGSLPSPVQEGPDRRDSSPSPSPSQRLRVDASLRSRSTARLGPWMEVWTKGPWAQVDRRRTCGFRGGGGAWRLL